MILRETSCNHAKEFLRDISFHIHTERGVEPYDLTFDFDVFKPIKIWIINNFNQIYVTILKASSRSTRHLMTLEALFINQLKPQLNTNDEYSVYP